MLLCRPRYVAGGWVWIYNTAATIRQGLRKGVNNKVLKEKLFLNWTGPFKIVDVGPSPVTNQPNGHQLGDKLLYLDLPSILYGPTVNASVIRLLLHHRVNLIDNYHSAISSYNALHSQNLTSR